MTRRRYATCGAAALAALLAAGGCSLSLPSRFTSADGGVDGQGDGDAACPEGLNPCGGACVDPRSDPANCGACGTACGEEMTCAEGACACGEGLTDCGGACRDTRSDPWNCGTCGNACADGWVCSAGACAPDCAGGLTNCGGACVDLATDRDNCGACGRDCPSATGATPACRESLCRLDCNPGRYDLDGAPGCEYACAYQSPVETCNGADDNCDGAADETFDCPRGATVSCTSECGSRGQGACTAGCAFPGAEECDPPAESCNGLDDDCDGAADGGFACVLDRMEPCSTACGTAGMKKCMGPSCAWGTCCAPAEVCGNGCDDDCRGGPDDGCGAAPPNDTCAGPTDISGQGRFTGPIDMARDNASGSCATGGGKDVFFSFRLAALSDVFLSTFGSTFDTVFYVGTTCGGANWGCSNDYGANRQSYLSIRNLPAGTYYVTLDVNGGEARGSYVLDFYATPAGREGDACGSPLPFDAAARAVTGDTCGYGAEYRGSCSAASSPYPPPDRVYFVVVPNTSPAVNVTFSSCNGDTDYDSLMYLRSICTSEPYEVECVDDDGAACPAAEYKSVVTARLTPGVYYLFIDGWCSYRYCDDLCGEYRVTASGLP